MAQVAKALLAFAISISAVSRGTPRNNMGTHTRTHSTGAATCPYYGGGKHTASHDGRYPGETNSHHRNGHYSNWKSSNHYGINKQR